MKKKPQNIFYLPEKNDAVIFKTAAMDIGPFY